ncbi:MAG TPA: hypothetical protein VJI46_05155 [Candidatus Nanoarchaeia archaeon]|nr:hypothetical protein [Candidatus Nanoarchaeia archaeon]
MLGLVADNNKIASIGDSMFLEVMAPTLSLEEIAEAEAKKFDEEDSIYRQQKSLFEEYKRPHTNKAKNRLSDEKKAHALENSKPFDALPEAPKNEDKVVRGKERKKEDDAVQMSIYWQVQQEYLFGQEDYQKPKAIKLSPQIFTDRVKACGFVYFRTLRQELRKLNPLYSIVSWMMYSYLTMTKRIK